ncbi:MAG TPA: hypothetical protein VKT70_13050 [Stellaceae bacterium]|nr:hypothetical protein [Stellaceae bacterium]
MLTKVYIAAGLGLAALVAGVPARAEDNSTSVGFPQSWFDMATRTQDMQPHWMTPVVTVTPRLEQEVRYDQFDEALPHGKTLMNYDGGKGLELITSEATELIIGVPPYQTRSAPKPVNGFADDPVFLLKYRLLSANEQQGNYILTAFFQLSAPTGATVFTNNAYILQPTIAFGKGWGLFDIQSTVSQQYSIATNPAGHAFGDPILVNVAAQFHISNILWPELEANYTYFLNGARNDQSQLFFTPGIIFGRFPIYERVKVNIGVGYQIAVTDKAAFNHNLILTTRLTF